MLEIEGKLPKNTKVLVTIQRIESFGLFVNIERDDIASSVIGIIHLVPELTSIGYVNTSSFEVGKKLECIVVDHKETEVYLKPIGIKSNSSLRSKT
ncbi:hypothetical protein [Microscilla marina]|uniref:S1 motif domain-containing protein n=1 Tax=Microscilla marina ATCC 23134 TaxID=313606 RepID=A1ZZM2_MICM2|nr:hypothetical protein [Microscilla marina]EAY24176.1 hypothetical protein M23134_00907 [Microscilla marina ATCC 23134]